jgi:hypothetical protein
MFDQLQDSSTDSGSPVSLDEVLAEGRRRRWHRRAAVGGSGSLLLAAAVVGSLVLMNGTSRRVDVATTPLSVAPTPATTAPSAASPVVTSIANPTTTPPPPTYQGDLRQQRRYPSAQITLDPPGLSRSTNAPNAAQRPKASWQAAYDTCTSGEAPCVPGQSPIIELAMFTDLTYGPADKANPNAPVNPTYRNFRVWTMTWHGVDCELAGPGPGGAPTAPSATVNLKGACDQVAFVDADTGKYLLAYQGAPAQ